jgi:hypothetical protein|eukprot:COSAG06_NODE_390_length_16395_cov_6.904332_12_plen_115_part_00
MLQEANAAAEAELSPARLKPVYNSQDDDDDEEEALFLNDDDDDDDDGSDEQSRHSSGGLMLAGHGVDGHDGLDTGSPAGWGSPRCVHTKTNSSTRSLVDHQNDRLAKVSLSLPR